MYQRDHTVDTGVVGKDAGPRHLVGDEARGTGRAVNRGQHSDVVARAVLTVRAAEAAEAAPLLRRHECGRLRFGAEGIVAVEGVEIYIVLVHPASRRDILPGEADHLPVFDHGGIARDRLDRHLVAARHALRSRDAHDGVAGAEGFDRHHDVVGVGKSECARCRCRQHVVEIA